jgi:hypothetical protein
VLFTVCCVLCDVCCYLMFAVSWFHFSCLLFALVVCCQLSVV